jgi:hypothetical protein
LSPGAVKIEGHIGEKIDQCIHNRIKVQQRDNLVEIFQTKELDPSGYRGEFIGNGLLLVWLTGTNRILFFPIRNEMLNLELKVTQTNGGRFFLSRQLVVRAIHQKWWVALLCLYKLKLMTIEVNSCVWGVFRQLLIYRHVTEL